MVNNKLRWLLSGLIPLFILFGLNLTTFSAQIKLVETERIKIGIFSWEKNKGKSQIFLQWLKDEFSNVRTLSVEDITVSDSLKKETVSILIVPEAKMIPLEVWKRIPEYQSKGGHVIFEGYPDQPCIKKEGVWKRHALNYSSRGSDWGGATPGSAGDLHCYYETKQYPGIPGGGEEVFLRMDKCLSGLIDFKERELFGQGGGYYSVQKYVYRYPHDTRGKLEYRDCIEYLPFYFTDEKGEILAQQAVVIRHHCRLFNGASTIFVDITDPHRKGYRLLEGEKSKKILSILIRLAFTQLPGEQTKETYETFIELKEKVSDLKDKYVESIYQDQDIWFLAENGRAQEKVKGIRQRQEEYERGALNLIKAFNVWRDNTKDSGLKMKGRILLETKKLLKEGESLLKEQKQMLVHLMANTRQREVPLPAEGEFTFGFAFGMPKFAYSGKDALPAMKEAGMDVYVDGYYHNWVTDNRELYEAKRDLLREKYSAAGVKLTAHEFYHPLPEALTREYARKEGGRKIFDLNKGEFGKVDKNSVTPVFSRAFEDSRYLKFLEKRAGFLSESDWIHNRGITLEGIIGEGDGYDNYTVERYRGWLKGYHAKIQTLNKHWGTTYQDFGEIDCPRRYPATQPQHANWYDWVQFRCEEVNKYFQRISDIYKKYDKKHLIVGCMNQWHPLAGVDLYAYNQCFDRANCHNTATSQPWYLPGLARKGQKAENNEVKATNKSYPWSKGDEESYQKNFRYYVLYTYSRGVIEQEEHHWGFGHGSLGEMDGFYNLAGAESKHLNLWKRKWKRIAGAIPPHEWAEVGLYWSFETKSHAHGGLLDNRQGLYAACFRVMDNWNVLLDGLQCPFETIVRQKVKQSISHLKLIIVPESVYLEKEVIEKLLAYVKEGGKLLIIGETGKWDEYKKENKLLFKEPGIVHGPTQQKEISIDGIKYVTPSLVTAEGVSPARIRFRELFPGKAKILYPYVDGGTAALRVNFGRGEITYFGFGPQGDSNVLKGQFSEESEVVKIMEEILLWANIKRPIQSSDHNIRVATWKGEKDWYYSIIQNFEDRKKLVTIVIDSKVAAIVEINLGVDLKKEEKDKKTVFEIPIIGAGARVIAWRKK